MKYLKYFETEAAYASYKNGSDYILPNVSYAKDNNTIYYNPFAEAKSGVIMAHYSVMEENKLALGNTSNVKSLKVNGTEVEFGDTYYFNEVGEYDVEIELIDSTLINGIIFDDGNGPNSGGTPISNPMFCDVLNKVYQTSLTSIVIPDSVTTIERYAFTTCTSLTDIHIGSGVTSIGNQAFMNCSGLTEITCNAMTAPTIGGGTFYGVKKYGVLKVPAGSDYSSWMSTEEYYLGYRKWTIEYI